MSHICWIKTNHKRPPLTEPLLEIKAELIKSKPQFKQVLNEEERWLVDMIYSKTAEHNLNNVTRTKAYLDFYRLHPEIHWAFLGHMVSRNGGWSMTDLKGDLISNLLDKKTKVEFFTFLERGNWLIFQDAYPQFLLYEESIKRRRNLFYLLSHFNISIFMETIWNYFWKRGNKYILTMALVVNEQSYLEHKVMKNTKFKEKVFDTFEFKLQELLSFNHILFPYFQRDKTKIVGQTVNQFDSLHERILLGKRLYSLLFSKSDILKNAVGWAARHPHTGSRKDFWPHLFNDIKEYAPGHLYVKRLKRCKIRPRAARFYSPKLEFAWKNVDHQPAGEGDWFEDWRVIDYLIDEHIKVDGEIKHEYCETLEKLELANIAKKAIFL